MQHLSFPEAIMKSPINHQDQCRIFHKPWSIHCRVATSRACYDPKCTQILKKISFTKPMSMSEMYSDDVNVDVDDVQHKSFLKSSSYNGNL